MTRGDEGRPRAGFLSEAWVEALGASVRASAVRHAGVVGAGGALTLGVLVTGVPWATDGEFAYTVMLSPDADVVVGIKADADVVLVGSHAAFQGLAEGGRTVGQLLDAGAIRVRGDVSRLLAAGAMIAVLSGDRDEHHPDPASGGSHGRLAVPT